MSNSIYKSLINLEKKSNELFFLLKKTKIMADEKCQSAYVIFNNSSQFFEIHINKSWIESFDVHNLSAIIEHELLHILLNHCMLYSEKTFTDKKTLNVAQDSIINEIGEFLKDRKKLNDELNNGIFLNDLNKKYNQSFCSNRNTSAQIYDFLMGQNDKDKNKDKSFDEGMKSEISEDKGSQSDDNSDGKSQAVDKQKDALNEALNSSGIDLNDLFPAEEIAEALGKLAGKSSDINSHFQAIRKIENNKFIKREIEKFFGNNKENWKKSIKKINRRFNSVPFGKTKNDTQKVLLALDVSGSMLSENELEKLKMTVNVALKNEYEVDLIFGDTKKLGSFKNIKKNFNFEENVFGGGGTTLTFICEEKNINDYDCIVITTDGYFDNKELDLKLKNSILILNTSDKNSAVKGFKNLHI